MPNDSDDQPEKSRPPSALPESSAAGILLIVLACLPYIGLLAVLPGSDDFPNESGGEARMALAWQEFWANAFCGLLTLSLGGALWCGVRKGGIVRGRPWLTFAAGGAAAAATFIAVGVTFEQPGGVVALLPAILPPVVALYALWGCLPMLAPSVSRRFADRVGPGLIGVLSLALLPLVVIDSVIWPARLARHNAERAAREAASRAEGERAEAELRAKYQRLGPDSSLSDYLEGEYRYLSGVDVLAAARQVKSRQTDAVAMLERGEILDLSDLWRLDLEPAPALCAAYRVAFRRAFVDEAITRGSAFLNLIDRQVSNLRWLHEAGCDFRETVERTDARLRDMLESKDPSGASRDDPAAFYSRWGVSRDRVEATRVNLAGFGQ